MYLATVALSEAEGRMAPHGVRCPGLALAKGAHYDSQALNSLAQAGVHQVPVVVLEEGDVDENTAATTIGSAITGPGLRADPAATGRLNVRAEHDGLLRYAPNMLCALNRLDERLSVAVLPPNTRVRTGDLLVSIKIIPYAIPTSLMEHALNTFHQPMEVKHFPPRDVALILVEGPKDSVMQKTLDAQKTRLNHYSARLRSWVHCADHNHALTATLRALAEETSPVDLILIVGAQAIVDRTDHIPTALRAAGGHIERFGIPVDPGNLTLIGRLGTSRVIGMPGCARSVAANGVDLVLDRVFADLDLEDLADLGVGGLRKETPGRPLVRQDIHARQPPRIAGIMLAAGTSSRMGPRNKLTEPWQGRPLITWALERFHNAPLQQRFVVVGHQSDAIAPLANSLGLTAIYNPNFASGMASSLVAGIGALDEHIDAVAFFLGDMPDIAPETIAAVLDAFDPLHGHAICAPRHKNQLGHPVVFGRRFFPLLRQLQGDQGARSLINRYPETLKDIPGNDPGCLFDIDSPEHFLTPAS